jgi:hypothetical protein
MNFLPSFSPEGLAKNWTKKVLLGVELSTPWMVVAPLEVVVAEVRTGKFCRLLAPVSGSLGSFRVRPSPLRSMPRPSFEKMELERTRLPVVGGHRR